VYLIKVLKVPKIGSLEGFLFMLAERWK
jgi:hypothetical protein